MRPSVRKLRQRKTIRVVAVQPAIIEEIDAQRLARVERLLAEVEEADLVVLPELWRVGYSDFASYSKKAEAIDEDRGTVSFLSAAAKQLGSYLLGGSIVERRGEALYNTAVLLDPAGEQIGVYRKTHLLSYHSQERNLLAVGNQITVVETEIGRLGLAICYDLRFPELFRTMSTKGAEVFLVPAAWPAVRSDAWKCLCRARAVENQAFVIACNATGRGLLGRSMVVDPWGVKIAALGGKEGMLHANIDPETVREFREEFPAWRER
jgi:predicted amidohydrolase